VAVLVDTRFCAVPVARLDMRQIIEILLAGLLHNTATIQLQTILPASTMDMTMAMDEYLHLTTFVLRRYSY
jgi:hypothetical protein